MRTDRAELSSKIKKLKSVVPAKANRPEMQGILVRDGYLTASNMELTVRARTDGAGGEAFMIPSKAFDLINNLPDGEVEIMPGRNQDTYTILIRMEKIRNRYQVMDPSLFPLPAADHCEGNEEFTVDGGALITSMKRVSFAVSASDGNPVLKTLCLHAAGGTLNFVGSDGHVMAWDRMDFDGEFRMLIPRAAVDRLVSMGIKGQVSIRHNGTSAIFVSDEYEVYTRIVSGEYFRYQDIFGELRLHTVISRTELLDAMTRAKMCTEEKCPVKFAMDSFQLRLSIRDRVTDYDETLELQEEMPEPLTIAFDAGLVLETLKAFGCDNVGLSFDSPKMPMIVEAEDSDFRAVVLPVVVG